jgi:YVTN family beta-propeller protein
MLPIKRPILFVLLTVLSIEPTFASPVQGNYDASQLPIAMGTASTTKSSAFNAQIKNNTLAISPDETIALVAYSDNACVEAIDLKNGNRQRIEGFITPRSIVFSPDGARVYISDSSMGLVKILDTKTFAVQNQIAIGPGSFGLALTPDGRKLYVNNEAASTVTVIDTVRQSPVKVIRGFSRPRQGIVVSPDGAKVYVTNFGSGRVSVVNSSKDEIESEISGFDGIRAIRLTRDGRFLYGANSGSNDVAVVDTGSGKIVATIPAGREPYGVTLSPDDRILYIANKADNNIYVVDTATRRRLGVINGFNEPRQAVVFSKDGQKAYILNRDLSIAVVDTQHNKIAQTLNISISNAMPKN